MQFDWRSLAVVVGVVGVVVCPLAGAWAITVPPGFTLEIDVVETAGGSWTGTETTLSSELSMTSQGDETTLSLMAPRNVLGGHATIESWVTTWDPDPFITNDFVVVNNSGATQTYAVAVGAPVSPAFPATSIVQSNIILSINDDDGVGGASVQSVVSTPVYEAFVNGVSALTFLDDPFSNSCASAFDCTFNGTSAAAVASQAFGPVSATSMGITITFELSPGDSAAVQSRFEIVPEPGTAALLGLGLVGLSAVRRLRAR
ncbi:MAG: PEP-CTERM sorting domain-containing protein [Myxococcota bacterium]